VAGLERPPSQPAVVASASTSHPPLDGWVRPAPSKGSRGKDVGTNAGSGRQSRRGCLHGLGGTRVASYRMSQHARGHRGHGATKEASRAGVRRRSLRQRRSSGTKQRKGGPAELQVEAVIPAASEVGVAGSGRTSRAAEAGQGGGGPFPDVSMVIVPGRVGEEGRERSEESPDLPTSEAKVAGVGRSRRRPRSRLARVNLPPT
jgi:hypothetical protein